MNGWAFRAEQSIDAGGAGNFAADEYLSKPVSPGLLLVLVMRHCR